MVRLSRILLRQQMFDEATVVVERAKSIAPHDPEVAVSEAVLLSATGNTDQALSALNAILKDHPNIADAWFFRGMIGMQSQNPALAQESWRKFVEVAPPGPRRDRIQGFLDGEGLKMPGPRNR